MPLHIFNPSFPIPVKLNSQYKFAGMNWWWGNYKCWHGKIDATPNNFGEAPVQNVGVNEGYEGVLTAGLYDCFGLALIEREIATGNITRISMVHLRSNYWDDQVLAMKVQLLDKFSLDSNQYDRYVVLFPGCQNTILGYCSMDKQKQMLNSIANILSVKRNNIFINTGDSSAYGSISACVTFDGFAGNVDYLNIELNREVIKADLKLLDDDNALESTLDLIHISDASLRYATLFKKHLYLGDIHHPFLRCMGNAVKHDLVHRFIANHLIRISRGGDYHVNEQNDKPTLSVMENNTLDSMLGLMKDLKNTDKMFPIITVSHNPSAVGSTLPHRQSTRIDRTTVSEESNQTRPSVERKPEKNRQ